MAGVTGRQGLTAHHPMRLQEMGLEVSEKSWDSAGFRNRTFRWELTRTTENKTNNLPAINILQPFQVGIPVPITLYKLSR